VTEIVTADSRIPRTQIRNVGCESLAPRLTSGRNARHAPLCEPTHLRRPRRVSSGGPCKWTQSSPKASAALRSARLTYLRA